MKLKVSSAGLGLTVSDVLKWEATPLTRIRVAAPKDTKIGDLISHPLTGVKLVALSDEVGGSVLVQPYGCIIDLQHINADEDDLAELVGDGNNHAIFYQNQPDGLIPVSKSDTSQPSAPDPVPQVDDAQWQERLQQIQDQVNAFDFVQGLDKSSTSTIFFHNSSDVAPLMTKSGIFYITSAVHLRAMGFPGHGRSAILKVIVVGPGLVFWELTIPETGMTATRIYRNNTWSAWNINTSLNGAFNPGYHRDAVVAFGSSTMATLAEYLKPEFEKYGINFINKAASGSRLALVSLAVGAVKVRVKFPDGVIPAKTIKANAELVFDGAPISLSNQYLILQNGIKGLVAGVGTSITFTPRDNAVSYDVDPNHEFPAQPYVIRGYENGISIISSGKNDISLNAKADELKAPFEEIIKHLKPELQPRFIVVGQYSNPGYSATQKAELDKYNEWQRKTYGPRYFDLLAFLQSDECKNSMQTATGSALSPEDEALLADGRLPVAWSVEATTAKAAHLNAALMQIVAPKIAQKAVELTYIGTPGSWLTANTPVI